MTIKMDKDFWKFLCSMPGLVLIAIVLFLVSLLFDKLFGASYFTMATITVVFLIFLSFYLSMNLFESKLLKKIRKSIGKHEN